jgi:hypothetical protein
MARRDCRCGAADGGDEAIPREIGKLWSRFAAAPRNDNTQIFDELLTPHQRWRCIAASGRNIRSVSAGWPALQPGMHRSAATRSAFGVSAVRSTIIPFGLVTYSEVHDPERCGGSFCNEHERECIERPESFAMASASITQISVSGSSSGPSQIPASPCRRRGLIVAAID